MRKKLLDYVSKFKGKSVPYGIFLLAFAAIFICFTMWQHGRGSAAENAGNASADSGSEAGNGTVTGAGKSGNIDVDSTSEGKKDETIWIIHQ